METSKSNRGFVPLVLAAAATALYLGFAVPYHLLTAPDGISLIIEKITEVIGREPDTALIVPHLIAVGAALFFNVLGAISLKRIPAFLGIAGYIAAIVLFYPYGVFTAAQILLSLIGILRIRNVKKKKRRAAKEESTTKEENTAKEENAAQPA